MISTMVNCACHWISARNAALSCLTTQKMEKKMLAIICAYDTVQDRLVTLSLAFTVSFNTQKQVLYAR